MIIRSLDAQHDWNVGKGIQDYSIDQAAIMENIQTRLLSFLNDCFFDAGAGIDWLRLLGTPGTKNEMLLNCRAIILQSSGVVKLNSLTISTTGRAAILTFNVNTIFTSQFAASLEVL